VYGRVVGLDGGIISSSLIGMDSVIDRVITDREESEQSIIDTGAVIIRSLEQFLKSGVWHCGLRRQDGTVVLDPSRWPSRNGEDECPPDGWAPIIWFGLEGEEPIECWSLTLDGRMFEKELLYGTEYSKETCYVERWKRFWFPTFWALDWNTLFDYENGFGRAYTYTTWMFAECGMDEPEELFELVRAACPIELDSADTKIVLERKIWSLLEETAATWSGFSGGPIGRDK
jgi:hypothetical protein